MVVVIFIIITAAILEEAGNGESKHPTRLKFTSGVLWKEGWSS